MGKLVKIVLAVAVPLAVVKAVSWARANGRELAEAEREGAFGR